jgi:hypothetical protein
MSFTEGDNPECLQQEQHEWQTFAPFWLDPVPDPLPVLASRRAALRERKSLDLPTAV